MVRLPFRTIVLTVVCVLVAASTYPDQAIVYIAYTSAVLDWVRASLGRYGDWVDFVTVYGTLLFVVLVIVGLFVSVQEALKKAR